MINSTDLIVHVIQPKDILDIVNSMNFYLNVNDFEMNQKDTIQNELEILKAKIKTLIPKPQKHLRSKRGLINIIGQASKYLFGTMDDKDRIDIEEHFATIDGNLHNSITNLNQQIKINDYFNKTFEYLRDTIEKDRNSVKNGLEDIDTKIKHLYRKYLFNDLLFRINMIKEQINSIQDSIASARSGILHPNILTNREIDSYHIDLYKLRMIRICALEYENEKLIFIIKVPSNFDKVQLKLLAPITNKDFREIEGDQEFIIEYGDKTFMYQDEKTINELKQSKHCIVIKNCRLVYNNRTEIIHIDEETILVKNAVRQKIEQSCDERKFILDGNYLIHFGNCSLQIADRYYSNKKHIFEQRFYYPEIINYNFSTDISFEEIKVHTSEYLLSTQQRSIPKYLLIICIQTSTHNCVTKNNYPHLLSL